MTAPDPFALGGRQDADLIALIVEYKSLQDEGMRLRSIADHAFFALPKALKYPRLGDDEAKFDLPCGALYRAAIAVEEPADALFGQIQSIRPTTCAGLIAKIECLGEACEIDEIVDWLQTLAEREAGQ